MRVKCGQQKHPEKIASLLACLRIMHHCLRGKLVSINPNISPKLLTDVDKNVATQTSNIHDIKQLLERNEELIDQNDPLTVLSNANYLALVPRETGQVKLRFLGMHAFDRPNSTACRLGRYCKCDTTPKTFVLASPDTLQAPFTTRETVAVETPASLATSFSVHARTFI